MADRPVSQYGPSQCSQSGIRPWNGGGGGGRLQRYIRVAGGTVSDKYFEPGQAPYVQKPEF